MSVGGGGTPEGGRGGKPVGSGASGEGGAGGPQGGIRGANTALSC